MCVSNKLNCPFKEMPAKVNMSYLKNMVATLIRRITIQDVELGEVYAEMDKLAAVAEQLDPLSVSQRIGRTIGNAALVVMNDLHFKTNIPAEERREAYMSIIGKLKERLDEEYPVSDCADASCSDEEDEEDDEEEEVESEPEPSKIEQNLSRSRKRSRERAPSPTRCRQVGEELTQRLDVPPATQLIEEEILTRQNAEVLGV